MPYSEYLRWKNQPLECSPFLSVVIPAYNEAGRILPTVGAVAYYVSSLGFPWELIVADDGSVDGTSDLLNGLGMVNLRVLRSEENRGKGHAVRRGMLAARGEFVLFHDADNSTPIEQLPVLLHALQVRGYDVAAGSRTAEGAKEGERSALRKAASVTFRYMVRKLFHLAVVDTQCGFKLFRRDAVKRLCSVQTLEGFSFDLELLYLASRFGYRVIEIPVEWVDSPGSTVNLARDVHGFLGSLLKIKFNAWRGVYSRV